MSMDPEAQAMWNAYAAFNARPPQEWGRMLNWLLGRLRSDARKRGLSKRAAELKGENPEKAAYARDMILDAINLLRSEGLSAAELTAGVGMALAHTAITSRDLRELTNMAVRHRENLNLNPS